MRPVYFVMALFIAASLTASYRAAGQASKKLEERSKGLDQGQQKSWQQVDEINKETDKTKARYQQAQQQQPQYQQKGGPTIKKTRVGTATTPKATAPKKKPAQKKTPGKK